MQKTILALSLHINKWGAERSMCEALSYLKNKGFRVVVIITSHGDIEELLNQFDIEYYISPLDSLVIQYRPNLLHRVKHVYLKTKRCLQNNKCIYNILNSNNISPDIVYTNTLIPFNGLFISKHYKAKHIVHIREFLEEDFNFRYLLWNPIYLKILEHNVYMFLCISNSIRIKFSRYFGQKAKLIYNGVKTHPRLAINKVHKNNEVAFVFVGRLSEEKGIMNILQSFDSVIKNGISNVHLDIWGNGPLEDKIREFVKLHGIQDYISICGYGNDIDMSSYDVGIMASKCEGFGRTTVEYMMSGLVVIGYNGGATPEIVEDCITGYIYSDNIQLISSIKKVAKMNKEDLLSMGIKGYERAKTNFSQERYLDEVYNIFKSL